MKNAPPAAKAVAFDCDGVLVDSETLAAKVLAEVLGQSAVSTPEIGELLRRIAGVRLANWIDELRIDYGDRVIPHTFEQRFRALVDERYTTALKPMPNIELAIHAAPKDNRVVVSNAPLWKIQSGLTLTGLDCLFARGHVSAYDIKSWKPDPRPYLIAAEGFQCDPGEMIVVEDSLAGLTSATKAGAITILYSPPERPYCRDLHAMADFVAHDHRETARLIERLSNDDDDRPSRRRSGSVARRAPGG